MHFSIFLKVPWLFCFCFPQDARKVATRVQNKVDALPEGFAEKDQEDVKDFRTFIHLTNMSK